MLRNLTATDTAYLKSTAAAMIQEVFLIGQKFVLMMNATECVFSTLPVNVAVEVVVHQSASTTLPQRWQQCGQGGD